MVDEFLHSARKIVQEEEHKERKGLLRAFKLLDPACSGFVPMASWCKMLRFLRKGMSQQEAEIRCAPRAARRPRHLGPTARSPFARLDGRRAATSPPPPARVAQRGGSASRAVAQPLVRSVVPAQLTRGASAAGARGSYHMMKPADPRGVHVLEFLHLKQNLAAMLEEDTRRRAVLPAVWWWARAALLFANALLFCVCSSPALPPPLRLPCVLAHTALLPPLLLDRASWAPTRRRLSTACLGTATAAAAVFWLQCLSTALPTAAAASSTAPGGGPLLLLLAGRPVSSWPGSWSKRPATLRAA